MSDIFIEQTIIGFSNIWSFSSRTQTLSELHKEQLYIGEIVNDGWIVERPFKFRIWFKWRKDQFKAKLINYSFKHLSIDLFHVERTKVISNAFEIIDRINSIFLIERKVMSKHRSNDLSNQLTAVRCVVEEVGLIRWEQRIFWSVKRFSRNEHQISIEPAMWIEKTDVFKEIVKFLRLLSYQNDGFAWKLLNAINSGLGAAVSDQLDIWLIQNNSNLLLLNSRSGIFIEAFQFSFSHFL